MFSRSCNLAINCQVVACFTKPNLSAMHDDSLSCLSLKHHRGCWRLLTRQWQPNQGEFIFIEWHDTRDCVYNGVWHKNPIPMQAKSGPKPSAWLIKHGYTEHNPRTYDELFCKSPIKMWLIFFKKRTTEESFDCVFAINNIVFDVWYPILMKWWNQFKSFKKWT